MNRNAKALWKQVCDIVLPHNPEWIKLLLDWKDAEQQELQENLRKYQNQRDELLEACKAALGVLTEDEWGVSIVLKKAITKSEGKD